MPESLQIDQAIGRNIPTQESQLEQPALVSSEVAKKIPDILQSIKEVNRRLWQREDIPSEMAHAALDNSDSLLAELDGTNVGDYIFYLSNFVYLYTMDLAEGRKSSDNSTQKMLSDFGVSFLTSHVSHIEQLMKNSGNVQSTRSILRSYGKILELSSNRQKEVISDFLISNMFTTVLNGIISPEEADVALGPVIVELLKHGATSAPFSIQRRLSVLVNTPETQSQGELLLPMMLDIQASEYGSAGYYLQTEDAAINMLTRYGLNPQELLSLWKRNIYSDRKFLQGNPKEIFSWVKRNLSQVILLEQRIPGISKVLREEFGIRNFARYPIEMLIQQYEERNRQDISYGLTIYAADDWNTALDNSEGQQVSKVINQGPQNTYGMRYIEVEGKEELKARLKKMQEKYNPDNLETKKLAFAVIGGHGRPDKIQLGQSTDRNHMLSIKDFDNKRDNWLMKYFQQNPTIILESCSTGKEPPLLGFLPSFRSIAREISSLGATVIAPDRDSSIKEVHLQMNAANKLAFRVIYKADGEAFNGLIFVNGRLVRNK